MSFAFVSRGCCNSCYGKTLAKRHQEIVTNPGQAPVVACDQPLFAIAKNIQWKWPLDYGEDKFVIMFGGLHIELAALKTLGDLLKDSGWTSALVQAGFTTTGTADSFLKAAHITRTRRAHQVTACVLYLVLEEAYQEYTNSMEPGTEVKSLEDWCEQQSSKPMLSFGLLYYSCSSLY